MMQGALTRRLFLAGAAATAATAARAQAQTRLRVYWWGAKERADRTKKTLEEVKANANIPAMQRSEAIRRAADWVIEHSTIEEK